MWRNTETQLSLFKAIAEKNIFIVFDTETTGLSYKTDQIIQFAATKVTISDDFKLNEGEKVEFFIKPRLPISDKIAVLTGITNEFLENMPTEDDVFPKIKQFIGTGNALVAYNSSFDIRFLSELYNRMGDVLEFSYDCDVLAMARDLVSKDITENYKLGTIAALYGFDDTEFHSAVNDKDVTVKLFQQFIDEYKERKIEESTSPIKKRCAYVDTCQFWEMHTKRMHMYRIYVNTNLGTVFFNINTHQWEEKDIGCMRIIDMEQLEKDVFAYTGTKNHEELCKWRHPGYKKRA